MECPIESRSARRRSRNRRHVLDEAEALFTAGSYASVRIDEIAERADVSVGTVYNYFGGKEGVYLAVTERVLDRVEELLAPAYDPALEAPTAVAMLGERYLQALIDNPIACRSLVSDALTPDGDVGAGAQERIARLYAAGAELIERGIAEGTIAPVDSAPAARFLIGAWNGVFASTFRTLAPRASIEEVTRTLDVGTDMLWRGMTCGIRHRDGGQDDDAQDGDGAAPR